jgi:hypothetical protein
MKRLLAVALILLASATASAQVQHPLPAVDGTINFNEVHSVEGQSQDELYSKAKLWFADAFRSSQNVIQLDDRENGIILGKGAFTTNERASRLTWRFTVKVQLRDERYKVEFYDIGYTYYAPGEPAIGLASRTVEIPLDSYFQARGQYRRNGALKRNAQFIADKTQEVFDSLSTSLRTSMSQRILKDDF